MPRMRSRGRRAAGRSVRWTNAIEHHEVVDKSRVSRLTVSLVKESGIGCPGCGVDRKRFGSRVEFREHVELCTKPTEET